MGQSEHIYKDSLRNIKIDLKELKVECKEYYPQKLVYELMIPHNWFKKIPALKPIHKMIDLANDAGLITRQEIVSMMPPILCDI